MRVQKKRFMQSERYNAIILVIKQTCPCNEDPLTLQRTFKKKKTGVYRGTIMFLIFALKHRLRVPVRTASVYPQCMS